MIPRVLIDSKRLYCKIIGGTDTVYVPLLHTPPSPSWNASYERDPM